MATAPEPLTIFTAPNGMRRLAPFGNITPPGQPGQQADVRKVDNQIIKGQEDRARMDKEFKRPPSSNKPAPAARSVAPAAAPAPAATPTLPPVTVTGTAMPGVNLKFPEDTPVYSMMLTFGQYNKDKVFKDAYVNHTEFITLPLPANLSESFGVSYGKTNLGPFGGPLAAALSEGYDQMRAGRGAGSVITEKFEQGVRRAMSDPTFVPIAIDAALRSSEQLRTAFSAATGLAPNPNPAVALQGVPLRTYSFAWRLAPETRKESQILFDIINSLKFFMLPRKLGFALEYPFLCDIVVWPFALSELMRFKTCFLTDVRVNYAPSGVPSFFAGTQDPTEVELTLSFQEIKMFDAEDFLTDLKSVPTAPPIR